MRDPVACSDGTVYEREAIEQHLENKRKSPLTGIRISDKLYPILIMRDMIEGYIQDNPDKQEDQYVPVPKKFRDAADNISLLLKFTENDYYEFIGELYSKLKVKREYIFKRIFANARISKHFMDTVNLVHSMTDEVGNGFIMADIVLQYGDDFDIEHVIQRMMQSHMPTCINVFNCSLRIIEIFLDMLEIDMKKNGNRVALVESDLDYVKNLVMNNKTLGSSQKTYIIVDVNKLIKKYNKKVERKLIQEQNKVKGRRIMVVFKWFRKTKNDTIELPFGRTTPLLSDDRMELQPGEHLI